MPCIHPNAAGLDIGARALVVAVPPDRPPEPGRGFETFPPALPALLAWLVQGGIDPVAMASTGGSGVPSCALLEPHGIHPYRVHARHVKTVPGRKRAWNEAQWLQKLHARGLLQGALRPEAELGI